jgi:hypothetical protein
MLVGVLASPVHVSSSRRGHFGRGPVPESGCFLSGQDLLTSYRRYRNPESYEEEALRLQLDSILLMAGRRPRTALWGVILGPNTADPGQAELLRAVLRARDGDVAKARGMLEGTLQRAQSAQRAQGRDGAKAYPYPTRILMSTGRRQPQLVLRASELGPDAFADAVALVNWWERMQEALMTRVLAVPVGLGERGAAPSRPSYTLVFDCEGLRPYHFGKAARHCAIELAAVMSEFFPDMIDHTDVRPLPAQVLGSGGMGAAWVGRNGRGNRGGMRQPCGMVVAPWHGSTSSMVSTSVRRSSMRHPSSPSAGPRSAHSCHRNSCGQSGSQAISTQVLHATGCSGLRWPLPAFRVSTHRRGMRMDMDTDSMPSRNSFPCHISCPPSPAHLGRTGDCSKLTPLTPSEAKRQRLRHIQGARWARVGERWGQPKWGKLPVFRGPPSICLPHMPPVQLPPLPLQPLARLAAGMRSRDDRHVA